MFNLIMATQKRKSKNLRDIFKDLEDLSEWFGKPDIDLNEALIRFSLGNDLIKEARAHLKETENEFKKLKSLKD